MKLMTLQKLSVFHVPQLVILYCLPVQYQCHVIDHEVSMQQIQSAVFRISILTSIGTVPKTWIHHMLASCAPEGSFWRCSACISAFTQ